MNKWTVEKINEFYTYLNEYFGLSVKPEIKIAEKKRLPLQWNEGKLLFVPEFFNDDEMEEDVRRNILILL